MIVSRNRGAFALTLLAGMLTLWGASAQPDVSAPPRALHEVPAPKSVSNSPGANDPSAPDTDDILGGTVVPPTPAILGKHREDSVTVGRLGIAEAALGLLNETNGGLAADMWVKSSRSEIESLLDRMPLATPDRFVRAMGRLVVLSQSDSPLGEGGKPLITLRLRKLLDAGLLKDAGALAQVAERKGDPEFDRLRAEALLYSGLETDACGEATAARLANADVFWLKLRAVCYALAGDSAAVELTRAVLAQPGASGFDILLSDLADHTAKSPGEIADPTAVDAFLLVKIGLPINETVARKLGVPGAVLTMRDGKNPFELREKLAAQLLSTGAVTTADMAALAMASPRDTTKRAHTPPAAVARDLVTALIGLHRSAESEADPAKKAASVNLAFRRGLKDGVPDLAALYFADIAKKITPTAKLKPNALAMSQVLLLAGKPDAAAAWYALLDANAPDDAEARAIIGSELNIVAQSAGSRTDGDAALQWFAQQSSEASPAPSPKQLVRAALVIGAHDALGLPLPAEAQAQLPGLVATQQAGRRPPPDSLKEIADAADKRGRQGETVLRILAVIGPGGAGDLAPDVTVSLVHTLKKVGLPVAARDLAISALLHQRLPVQIAQQR